MKKKCLVIFCLMAVVFVVTACGSKEENDVTAPSNENAEVLVGENVVQDDVSQNFLWKNELTSEDLDKIDDYIFPESYSYMVYKDGEEEVVSSWSLSYSVDENNNLLIPEYEDMVDRRILSSKLENGFIYTVSEITLKDGSKIIVSYANDPVSLKYLSTVAEDSNGNIKLYNFSY